MYTVLIMVIHIEVVEPVVSHYYRTDINEMIARLLVLEIEFTIIH